MNALSAQQWQYSLRNRDLLAKPIQKRKDVEASKNDSSVAEKKGKEALGPDNSNSPSAEKSNQQIVLREKEKKEAPVKEVEKTSAFSLENEISKLKVSIPLTEIMKNNSY